MSGADRPRFLFSFCPEKGRNVVMLQPQLIYRCGCGTRGLLLVSSSCLCRARTLTRLSIAPRWPCFICVFFENKTKVSVPPPRSRAGLPRSHDHLSAFRTRRHDRRPAGAQVHQDRVDHRRIQGQDRRHRGDPEHAGRWVRAPPV